MKGYVNLDGLLGQWCNIDSKTKGNRRASSLEKLKTQKQTLRRMDWAIIGENNNTYFVV